MKRQRRLGSERRRYSTNRPRSNQALSRSSRSRPARLFAATRTAASNEKPLLRQPALGLAWLEPFGLDGGFALAVRRDIAISRDIGSISDLAALPGALTFAADAGYLARPVDGLYALARRYGLSRPEASPRGSLRRHGRSDPMRGTEDQTPHRCVFDIRSPACRNTEKDRAETPVSGCGRRQGRPLWTATCFLAGARNGAG
jgi:hypothetical protein